jgi:GcrA cell cycle regulator
MGAEQDESLKQGWSPARIDLLRWHHALGLSAAVSATLIGQVTRNAVISKRRSLGLFGANPLRFAGESAQRVGQAFVRSTANTGALPSRSQPDDDGAGDRREPPPLVDTLAPRNANPKTLVDRVAGECAWPLGPADAEGNYRTLFCCAPVVSARSYCPAHLARAYQAPPAAPVCVAGTDSLCSDLIAARPNRESFV